MALLDTPQAMYPGMTSQYLIQNSYSRGYYRDHYDQEAITRFNIHQRLQMSPEYSNCRSVKEEGGTAFKPYTSPAQKNISTQANQHTKVFPF